MKIRIHDENAYKLDAVLTEHRCGVTLELFSVWPGANHPDAHRLLTLTLPAKSFLTLQRLLEEVAS